MKNSDLPMEQFPSNKEVIDYYLREDVSDFLFELCQTRELTFYYYSDKDFRVHGNKAKHITFHCVPDKDEFRANIQDVSRKYGQPHAYFFPFWGMGTRVNFPGQPGRIAGWDVRYELDLDFEASFDEILPLLAVFEYYRLNYWAKFSGHRSLHVILPAESFPADIRECANHDEWLRIVEKLNMLLCRFVPLFNKTWTGVAKDMILTAPYSFHRYHGLISIPLTFDQALNFDLNYARLENFKKVNISTRTDLYQENGLAELLSLAEEIDLNPMRALDIARKIFGSDKWQRRMEVYMSRDFVPSQDSITRVLFAGMRWTNYEKPAIGNDGIQNRLEKALVSIDDPYLKSVKIWRMMKGFGLTNWQESYYIFRKEISKLLAIWIRQGLRESVRELLKISVDSEWNTPVCLAVRFASFLPEAQETLIDELLKRFRKQENLDEGQKVFLALAIAENCKSDMSAIYKIAHHRQDPLVDVLVKYIEGSYPWKTEETPDVGIAVISILYGSHLLHEWLEGTINDELRTVTTILGETAHLTFTIKQQAKTTIGQLNLQEKNIFLFLQEVKMGLICT